MPRHISREQQYYPKLPIIILAVHLEFEKYLFILVTAMFILQKAASKQENLMAKHIIFN